jgi:hypothetical protein
VNLQRASQRLFPSLRPSSAAVAAPSGWAASIHVPRTGSGWLTALAALGATLVFGTWFGIRTFPWFGPLVADTLRSVAGSENVTRLEEVVAGVEDRAKQVASSGVARSLTDSTPPELLAPAPVNPAVEANRPQDFEPLFAKTASPEDGKWQQVAVRTSDEPVLYRSIIHPDPSRSYAELFVFALDLSKLRVEAVAGSVEPRSPSKTDADRAGVIPESDRGKLVAAFNGGFKAEHGQYGMAVDGTELLKPNPISCTFAGFENGTMSIASWPKLAQADQAAWWRQTPPCMIENGVMHPGLAVSTSKKWGATLEGDTVIRRSAVGLDANGKTLFVGISNSTTARALALGMERAGASSVAQLDVNFSFPRFLLYRDDADTQKLTAFGAVKGLLYQPDEFLGRPSTRDFFYVALR